MNGTVPVAGAAGLIGSYKTRRAAAHGIPSFCGLENGRLRRTLTAGPKRGERISVVIPVRNEALNIRSCIEGILGQTVAVDEIVVLDSGSTDGTLDILLDYLKVRILAINSEEFNHGETRNTGVRAAR
ncbi:MAG: glycosyltransferase [Gemmatimonadaceae bacterium]|nr:glycosyltransferase [Gemmatimonadaceae bacterium]